MWNCCKLCEVELPGNQNNIHNQFNQKDLRIELTGIISFSNLELKLNDYVIHFTNVYDFMCVLITQKLRMQMYIFPSDSMVLEYQNRKSTMILLNDFRF